MESSRLKDMRDKIASALSRELKIDSNEAHDLYRVWLYFERGGRNDGYFDHKIGRMVSYTSFEEGLKKRGYDMSVEEFERTVVSAALPAVTEENPTYSYSKFNPETWLIARKGISMHLLRLPVRAFTSALSLQDSSAHTTLL